ncbi:MAG: hypothetical protein JEY91_07030, partial [Spirochaetaceae bacterium]|nr:hypothetical protein [Spirochaetaceae bacterium]
KKLIVAETEDLATSELAENFDEINERFHPDGEEQKSLKITWGSGPTPLAASDYWIAETDTSPVPADRYKTFNFYIKNSLSSLWGTYEISLLDSRERGYRFNYTPGDSSWKKISLSLETGIITDETGSQLTTASIDSTMGELTKFRIRGAGTTAGTVYIDEIHFSDPTFSIEGNIELITDYSYPHTILETEKGFPILTDFSLSNQLRYNGGTVLSTVSERIHSLQNSTSLSIELLLLSISTNMKINWNQTSTELSGNHTLLFPSDFTYGYMGESYSRSGSQESSAMARDNLIRFTLPSLGFVNLTTTADGRDETLIQSWLAETQWTIASLFTVGGTLNFEMNSRWDKRDSGNYFSNWINDYSLMTPVSEDINNRSVKSSLDLALETESVGFTLSPYLSFNTEATSPGEQTNRGGFLFTLPIQIKGKNDSQWIITPTYKRTFLSSNTKESTDSFYGGFINLFHDLDLWLPLTTFIPVYELFALKTTERFETRTGSFNKASYSPDLGLEFSRKFGSNLYDLFLPYNFSAHFIRNFGKIDDSLFNENRFEFVFRQTAVNLFGNFGVYHKSDLYNTDEFSSVIQFNLSVEDDNIPKPSELIYQNYLSFYGNNNGMLILENRLEADFENTRISDILDFKFLWQRPVRENFDLQFLNDIIQKAHYWSHEESLQLKLDYPWEVSDLLEAPSINIMVKHLSRINVPGLGVLKGWLSLGFFYGEQALLRTGFETGLELEISF